MERNGDRWIDATDCAAFQEGGGDGIGTYSLFARRRDWVDREPFDLACAMTGAGHEIVQAAVVRYTTEWNQQPERHLVRFRLSGGGEVVLENQLAHPASWSNRDTGQEDLYALGEYLAIWRRSDGAVMTLPVCPAGGDRTDWTLAGKTIFKPS
jgi:hypothetical protein